MTATSNNKRVVLYGMAGVMLLLLVLVFAPPVWAHFYPGSRMLCEEKYFNCYNGRYCTANYVWTFCVSRDITDGPLTKYFTDGDYVVVPQSDPWKKRFDLIIDIGGHGHYWDANDFFTAELDSYKATFEEKKKFAERFLAIWQQQLTRQVHRYCAIMLLCDEIGSMKGIIGQVK